MKVPTITHSMGALPSDVPFTQIFDGFSVTFSTALNGRELKEAQTVSTVHVPIFAFG